MICDKGGGGDAASTEYLFIHRTVRKGGAAFKMTKKTFCNIFRPRRMGVETPTSPQLNPPMQQRFV